MYLRKKKYRIYHRLNLFKVQYYILSLNFSENKHNNAHIEIKFIFKLYDNIANRLGAKMNAWTLDKAE